MLRTKVKISGGRVFTVVLSVVAEYLVDAVDGARSGRQAAGHAVSVHQLSEPHSQTRGRTLKRHAAAAVHPPPHRNPSAPFKRLIIIAVL